MNNKGFTLIELLVSLALCSIVFVGATYGITTFLNNIEEKEYVDYITIIEDGTCLYVEEKSLRPSDCSNGCNIELLKEDVVKAGYLDEAYLISPIDEKIEKATVDVSWDINGEKKCTYIEEDK